MILCCVQGSPLEVKAKLDEMGFKNFNYLALCKYSTLELPSFDFIDDFDEDFTKNKDKYHKTYNLLKDEKSKKIFEKIINFKISKDISFMEGFTNDFENQYFDKDLIPKINNIRFVDGGAYVGDTLPNIIKYFPNFEKIYAIEPSLLHIDLAKKEFEDFENIEFINCGLGNKQENILEAEEKNIQHNCNHNYQTTNINKLDNLINDKVDFIKLDIEGAEVEALKGSKEIIKKYHPILAICIYHKASDWYMIPNLVLDIRDDYDIYLRHYMEGIYETVMYFIPKFVE